MADNDCGAYITANTPAPITLPASPPPGCTFTFDTATAKYYVNTSNSYAELQGYDGMLYQFTLPSAGAQHSFYTIQYNGQNWTAAEYSIMEHDNFSVVDAAQLANGQVYFQWDATNSRFELLPRNGPGGLIIDGRMGRVLNQLNDQYIWTGAANTTSDEVNYFYVRHPEDGETSEVTGTSGSQGQPIVLQLSDTQNAHAGDRVFLNCYNINGTIEANGIWTGTVVDSTDISLNNSSYVNQFSSSPNSECKILQLVSSTTGHTTSNQGVEILGGASPDAHYTLVGMSYVGDNHSVQDTPTHRNCASWYNRGLKTCINSYASDQTTNSTSYTELNSNVECDFVTWGTGAPTSRTDLPWSIAGSIGNNTGLDGAAVTAEFDAAIPEQEQTALLNPATPVGGFPFAVKGTKSGLSEGHHVFMLVGKAIRGGTATISGNTLIAVPTSFEVGVPQ